MQLSYSSLSVMKNCPRCFYYDRRLKIPRPQGIKSGMPNAVDSHLKKMLEPSLYKGTLPPHLLGDPRLEGFELYCGSDLKKMQNWKSNPYKMEDGKGNVIVGAFDALLHNPTTDEYAYLDFKSTGKDPAPDFGEKYYQSQCDIYTQFLIEGGKKVADFGVLLFFWPAVDVNGVLTFFSKPVFLTPHPEEAVKVFKEAIDLLDGPLPESSPDCEYCNFINSRLTNNG